MRNILALLFGLLATQAWAADNAVILTPGSGVTMKSKDVGGGVQAMQPILSDTSGNAIVKAGNTAAASDQAVVVSDPNVLAAVTGAIPAGTNNIGLTVPAAGTTGGATAYHVLPTASDNHVVIKNGAGTVYGVFVTNNSATKNYFRFYNAGTGFNGCNSATNIILGGEIPPSDSGVAISFAGAVGVAFATGLSVCITSVYGDTDTTNATASALIFNAFYQ
jgi:hypothetical protein